MKLTATLIALILGLVSFAQQTNSSKSQTTMPAETPVKEQSSPNPIANVEKTTSGSHFTYEFISNRVLDEARATRWESRYPSAYPNMISISIDVQTQTVVLVLPDTHTEAELEEMIARFGYSGYQLTN